MKTCIGEDRLFASIEIKGVTASCQVAVSWSWSEKVLNVSTVICLTFTICLNFKGRIFALLHKTWPDIFQKREKNIPTFQTMSPLYDSLKCAQCNCTESLLWKSIGEKQQLCNDCFEQTKISTKQEHETNRKAEDRRNKLRKSTRSTRYNGKNGNGPNNASVAANSNSNKSTTTKSSGRGRRSLFRRPPMKAPTIPATTQHVKSLFYKVNISFSSSINQSRRD